MVFLTYLLSLRRAIHLDDDNIIELEYTYFAAAKSSRFSLVQHTVLVPEAGHNACLAKRRTYATRIQICRMFKDCWNWRLLVSTFSPTYTGSSFVDLCSPPTPVQQQHSCCIYEPPAPLQPGIWQRCDERGIGSESCDSCCTGIRRLGHVDPS